MLRKYILLVWFPKQILKWQFRYEIEIKGTEKQNAYLVFLCVVIAWLNKQLNEIQMTKKQEVLGTSTPPSNATTRTGISAHNMVMSLTF